MSDIFDLGFSETKNELELNDVPVKGTLPEWLQGTLIRNGPGTFRVGDQSYRHWFDGLAMLHRFSIRGGKVSYANKFLSCKAYDEAMETGKISYSEFATDPCRSLFGKVTAVFNQKITDSAKVNVAKIADMMLALGETSMQIEFDPETLESVGVYQYEEKYKQHITTVHPLTDESKGLAYNLVTRFSRISHYRMLKIDAEGTSHVVGEIPVTEPAYIHSFGMSQRYLILVEFPLVVYPLKLLFQVKPYIENFQWKPKRGATFYIMDRENGELVRTVKTDAFFAFHHVNAFEEKNELIVDMDAYEDAEIIRSFYLDRLRDVKNELPFGRMMRFRINMDTKSITKEILSEACIELPRFDNDRFKMHKQYRYVYGIGINAEKRSGFYNQIVKIDINNGNSKHWFTPSCYPGEPVFVGRPGRKGEDEGVILSVVLDEKQGNSFLLVLDAGSFTEIARADIPQPILFGYHGAFF